MENKTTEGIYPKIEFSPEEVAIQHMLLEKKNCGVPLSLKEIIQVMHAKHASAVDNARSVRWSEAEVNLWKTILSAHPKRMDK